MREAERPKEPLKQEPQLLDTLPKPAIKLPSGMRVHVEAFRVTGNTSIATSVLAELVKPWEGKTLDLAGLNDAAGAITRHYQSQGYLLAYAYLPVQKIEAGVVQLAVLEGRLDVVEVVSAQDVRLQDEVIQAHMERTGESGEVKREDLERRLLLLNDMPGVVARSAFTPGEQPGSADLVVTVVEDDPLANRVEFNNHGSPSTGRYRLGTQFHLRDIFGLGDSTRFNLRVSDNGRLVDGGLATRVPIGGQGWAIDAGISRLTYNLGGAFSALGARGEANIFSLGTSYPLIRSLSQNLYIQGTVEHKRLVDYVTVLGSEAHKRSNALNINLPYDNRDGWLGGGRNYALLSASAGKLSLGSGTAGSLAKNGAYSKFGYDLRRNQTLIGSYSLLAQVRGQHAWDNLDSSEKLGLTGAQGVRAYSPGETSVDRGGIANLELRYTRPLTGGTLYLSLFHDYGWGDINVSPTAGTVGNQISLRATGVGLGWSAGEEWDATITAAWHGNDKPTVDGDRRPRIFLQVRKGY